MEIIGITIMWFGEVCSDLTRFFFGEKNPSPNISVAEHDRLFPLLLVPSGDQVLR